MRRVRAALGVTAVVGALAWAMAPASVASMVQGAVTPSTSASRQLGPGRPDLHGMHVVSSLPGHSAADCLAQVARAQARTRQGLKPASNFCYVSEIVAGPPSGVVRGSGASGRSGASPPPASPSAVPPDFCDGFSVALGVWQRPTRRQACDNDMWHYDIVDTDTGALTGQGWVEVNNRVYVPNETQPAINGNVQVVVTTQTPPFVTWGTGFPTSITGTLNGSQVTTLSAQARNGRARPASALPSPGGCIDTIQINCSFVDHWYTGTPGASWFGEGTLTVGFSTTDSFDFVQSAGWQLSASNSSWANSPIVSPIFAWPKVRCDNLALFPGSSCVWADIPAVWSVPPTLPAYAQHVRGALASGLPGGFGGAELHRLMDKAKQAANGKKACPNGVASPIAPRPANMECDEYPMRSTKEGASTTLTPGPARTQPQCQMPKSSLTATGPAGFSRCYIPATENGAAGNELKTFYNANRIYDGDPFFVNVGAPL